MTFSTARHTARALPGAIFMTCVIFALGFAAGTASNSHTGAQSAADQAFEPFWEALSLIETRYVDSVEIEVLVDGAIDGLVDALGDEYSGYIRPELYQRSIDFSGEYTGIGVIIETDEDLGEIEVVSVIVDSPAERAGVMPGDIFFEVDGQRVVGLSQAELSALVPGPPGSAVSITFKRGRDFVTFEILRDTIPLPNVSYELIGNNVVHIQMLDFNDLSRSQLDEALEAVDINTTSGLIFDLRGNPGGVLASAIEIGSAFIEDGVLLRQIARDQSEEVTRTTGGYADISVPIVVLVDETSASAAEALAGAMQDHGVATILGETTFGKGTVQNIPPLSNGGGLRLTVRRWLTPNGHWIHNQGIRPNIIVEWNPKTEEEEADDKQLRAALAILEQPRD